MGYRCEGSLLLEHDPSSCVSPALSKGLRRPSPHIHWFLRLHVRKSRRATFYVSKTTVCVTHKSKSSSATACVRTREAIMSWPV
jgi:hypothetical protein